ncbi:MAG: CDP-alcohol phosphatidyltransferase family protein [Promethearchaeota archaeon]
MPSRYRLRRVFRPLVQGVSRVFIKFHFSPNSISVLSFFVMCLAGLLLFLFNLFTLYGLLVFFGGLLDGVDGEVARRTGRTSQRGGFLDSFLDRLADIVVLLPFLCIPNPFPSLGPSWIWVFLATTGCILVSYTRSRATAAGATDTDVGLGGRSERLFLLVVTALLHPFNPVMPYVGLLLMTPLSHLTVLYRVLVYHNRLQPAVIAKT